MYILFQFFLINKFFCFKQRFLIVSLAVFITQQTQKNDFSFMWNVMCILFYLFLFLVTFSNSQFSCVHNSIYIGKRLQFHVEREVYSFLVFLINKWFFVFYQCFLIVSLAVFITQQIQKNDFSFMWNVTYILFQFFLINKCFFVLLLL